MQLQDLIARMRRELGDRGTPFQDIFTGTNEQDRYDLSESSIAFLSSVTLTVNNATTPLTEDRDYELDDEQGRILLLSGPLAQGAILVVTGAASGMFSSSELAEFADEAVTMHCNKRYTSARTQDAHGFIKYIDTPVALGNLPEIEELPLVLLAVVNALWSLATDSATDVDIDTAEGTHVDRAQRFGQIMSMIDAVTARYHDYCQQLNIGMWRIEVSQLRRVSRTTSRLIPIYREREYDDYGGAIRELPPIDHPYDDPSEIPNPGFGGGWW